jgi:hypothetical protein
MATRAPVYCNWLQSVEGNIDPAHLSTLHVAYRDLEPVPEGTTGLGPPSPRVAAHIRATSRYVRVEVQDTAYGFRVIGVWPAAAGQQYVRLNCHVLPTLTFIGSPGRAGAVAIIVPQDDVTALRFTIGYAPDRAYTAAERQGMRAYHMQMDPANPTRRHKRLENDYLIDRVAQKHTLRAGIWPLPEQDYAMVESMGAIVDRTQEHLYAADAAIIRLRQQLRRAAEQVAAGGAPPGLDPSIPFAAIRSDERIIALQDDPWQLGAAAEETAPRDELPLYEQAGRGEAHAPTGGQAMDVGDPCVSGRSPATGQAPLAMTS